MLGDDRPDSGLPCVLTDSLFASLFLHNFLMLLTLISDGDDDLLFGCALALAALAISSDSIEKRLDGVSDCGRESPGFGLGTINEALSGRVRTWVAEPSSL